MTDLIALNSSLLLKPRIMVMSVFQLCTMVLIYVLLGQYLIFLQEHLHWIILITAHVLADAGKGEQPMIPDPIMQLSSTQVS